MVLSLPDWQSGSFLKRRRESPRLNTGQTGQIDLSDVSTKVFLESAESAAAKQEGPVGEKLEMYPPGD
jgi:hypothetical protein